MADQAIGELIQAQSIGPTDLFVLEQSNVAKSLKGQVLLNWLTAAADGHGGIQSIEIQSTSGLEITYRITLADTTIFDFVVTNGRGITKIEPTKTVGLVVTYTITYNDGTTSTFTVTNGEKGDKGDTPHIWIRYASQKPTDSSPSFGLLPDDWMGQAVNYNDTAPTDWKEYEWFKIKGEKGDPGAPATLISAEVAYQVGDSGTIIPSGAWSASIPVVAQGKYLWTRIVQQFNTGNPVTAYTISRMGMDGLGAVSSVCGVSPDPDGNVALTAEDVGAMSTSGGTMTGPINMNGQPITGLNPPTEDAHAANKGYVDTNKVDKANIVNNFTTTAEGFVADARALKALNDSKLSMELLWQNASPESTFAAQTVTLDFGENTHYTVEYDFYQGRGMYCTSGIAPVGKSTRLFFVTTGKDGISGQYRDFDSALKSFEDCKKLTDSTVESRGCIPTRIYGVKGVPV